MDMAYDILKEGAQPMHVSEILNRIKTRFGRQIDRESLVSALTKRVARADRFVRTGKNTFALRKAACGRDISGGGPPFHRNPACHPRA
ncbi:MAG: winged helix-turn-helix domain-containing protein [Verrucomicrobia bacterium]|nr:winged helix-turn-helix domain-containing protein [Verrucomicrobiota bacterium]